MNTGSASVVISLCCLQTIAAGQQQQAQTVSKEILDAPGLVPNASFEDGTESPTAWKVESGEGKWSDGGKTGRRCLAITGKGQGACIWRCDGVALKPRTAYRLCGVVKADPNASGGSAIFGPSTNNRDYQIGPNWTPISFVFVTPDSIEGAYLRCGLWEVTGTLFFDDLRLNPVTPLYSRRGSLCLGAGERIEKGRYTFETDFWGEGSNESRTLVSHSAGFNSCRWVFGPGNVAVYAHQIGDCVQTSGKITIDIGHYGSGALIVECSKDGQAWQTIGTLDKLGSKEFTVPASLYPAPKLWTRLRGSEAKDGTAPGSFQVYKHSYEASLQGNPPDATGSTSYLEILKDDPSRKVTIDRIDTVDATGPILKGRIQSDRAAPNTRIALAMLQDGKPVISECRDLTLQSNTPSEFELPLGVASSGKFDLVLSVGSAEGPPAFVARTSRIVPSLHAADYGYLLASDSDGDVWWCEGTYKVSRGRPAPKAPTDAIRITAAGNEYEPFQLVLRPSSTIKDVRIAVGDLTGAAGTIPGSRIDIDRVAWVRVTHPTDAVGCAGEWPDPLPHLDAPFDVPAGTNQPIWLTAYVPSGTPAGEYKGHVVVQAGGQEKWRVPLSLRVLGFSLPKEAHVFATLGFDVSTFVKYHNLKTDQEIRQVYDLYMQNFAAHRISPYNPMSLDPMQLSFKNELPWVGGTRVRDVKASGEQSLKIVDDSPQQSVDAHTVALMPVDPQVGYVVTWKVKTDKPGQSYLVSVQNHDANKQWMSGRNMDLPATGSGTWQTETRDLSGRLPVESRFVSIVLRPTTWSEKGEAVGTAWFDDVSFRRAPDGPDLVPDGGFEKPLQGLDVTIDFSAFDRSAQRYLDEMGFTAFSLPVIGMGSGTFHSRSKGQINGFTQGTTEYDILMKKYLGRIERHLAEKGWLRKAYVYWFDEPEPKDYDFVKEGMAILKRSAPGITRMLTEQPEPALCGSVDLWCPLTGSYAEKACRERQAAGEHIMWYVCCGPREPYATLFIDHPAIDLRMWLWQTYQFDVEGILVWDTNYWTSPCAYPEPNDQNPYEDPMSYVSGYDTPVGTRLFWGNGDGRFIYPPNLKGAQDRQTRYLAGPVNSIRWEMLREGIEDFEYLWQLRHAVRTLKQRGITDSEVAEAEKLTTVPATISRTLTDFAKDPRPLYERRLQVGTALERLVVKYSLKPAAR